MNDQSQPVDPEDGQSTEDAEKKTAARSGHDTLSGEQHGKPRQAYLHPGGSESTREMRDTARRRRDAEDKLQQHLNEAKDHVPNEHHEHDPPGHGQGDKP